MWWTQLLVLLAMLPVVVALIMLFSHAFHYHEDPAYLAEETSAHISIFLPVRNEAKNLRRCLDSLLRISYPHEKLEILIGNDFSEDETAAIIKEYTSAHPHFKEVPITHDHFPSLKGKSNVLAHLAKEAEGDYFFFTDADMILPEDWIFYMLEGFKSEKNEKIGVVTGCTLVESKNFWAHFQSIDWAFALGMVYQFFHWRTPVTAMGNNMAVSREAYEATGGYGSFDLSITEDFELFRQILKQGYHFHQFYAPEVLGWTLPEPSWNALLHQRKRWMRGAFRLSPFMVAVLGIQAFYYPALIAIAFINPLEAFSIAGLKTIAQGMVQQRQMKKLKQPFPFLWYVGYEVYSGLLSLSLLIFYALPTGIHWKNRKY